MLNMQIQAITIIGTGNVATHLGKAFLKAGIQINAIVARDQQKAIALGAVLNNAPGLLLGDLLPPSDAYILAVKDDAIHEVAKTIAQKDRLLIHCSGASNGNILDVKGNEFGVMWPMQTLTKNNDVALNQTLIAVSGSNDDTLMAIAALARKISERIVEVSETQRAMLHLSAVWINNYTNHMFVIAEQLLKENNLDFNLFIPLIDEHIEKLKTMSADLLQTGPASRGDMVTLNKHRSMLKSHPEIQQLYDVLAQSVLNHSLKNKS